MALGLKSSWLKFEKFRFEMSGVEKFMVEKSGVEKFLLALGLKSPGLESSWLKSFG